MKGERAYQKDFRWSYDFGHFKQSRARGPEKNSLRLSQAERPSWLNHSENGECRKAAARDSGLLFEFPHVGDEALDVFVRHSLGGFHQDFAIFILETFFDCLERGIIFQVGLN